MNYRLLRNCNFYTCLFGSAYWWRDRLTGKGGGLHEFDCFSWRLAQKAVKMGDNTLLMVNFTMF